MGSGFSKMKKQAKALQSQMQEWKENAKTSSFEGTSGNGRVKVVLSGDKQLKSLSINPECVDPQDVEGLQDLIIEAFHQASKQIKEQPEYPSSLPFAL
ncbi:MAG: YbaB/EbfC family nucleoid-associated protein [Rhabdochlamydiaceae bacterium]